MPSAVIAGSRDKVLVEVLRELGLQIEETSELGGVLASPTEADLILVPGSSAEPEIELLQKIRRERPAAEVLLLVPGEDNETGFALSRLLHADLIFLPPDRRRARQTIERALERQRRRDRHHRLVKRLQSIAPEAAREVEALAREHEVQARALEEATRLRSAFIHNISHEVRTPITIMQGLLDVLADDLRRTLTEDQRDLLDRVQQSSENLLEMIQGVLDLSKAEAGLLETRPSRVYFPHLVADLRRSAEWLLRNKPVRLVLDVPRGIEWLTVDGARLRQTLTRLLSNAVKFTASGEIRFEARLKRSAPANGRSDPAGLIRAAPPEGDILEIVVTDTGKGISRLDQETIFEAFRQVDPSSTREHEGLGLGLAIVKEMSNLLGATIDVESRPGEGTRFTLRLPVTAIDAPAAPPRELVARKSRSEAPRVRDPRGVLPELASLSLAAPVSREDAIAFVLDFLDRTIHPEAAFFAEGGVAGWKVTDAASRGRQVVAPGSSPPLPATLLDALSHERRALRDKAVDEESVAWSAVAVAGELGSPPGLLAVCARGDDQAAAEDLRILQVAGRWLELERRRQRLLLLVGDLVAAVGRDFKTPLGSLLAYTQVLLRGLRGPLTPEQRDVALRLERTLHRVILSALDLLDAERAAARGFEVERASFSVERVIDHVLGRHGAAIEIGRYRVLREAIPALPLCLGDEIRTDRALSNLLRALLERLPEASEIRIRAGAAGEHVTCELSAALADSAAFAESLTGAPRPLDLTDTLGLRLARGWIEAQGGRIDVTADAGLLTLCFELPTASEA